MLRSFSLIQRFRGTSLASSGVVAFLLAWAAPVSAGGTMGSNGSAITTSEYAIDLFQGPIFAGTRTTGLAGAYVAIAEDVDGDLQNPASPAVRPFFSYTYFDYWLGFGLTFPATLQNMDFFNSGSTTHVANAPDSFVFLTPAVNLQFGNFGIGLSLGMQQYALTAPPDMATPDTGDAIENTFNVIIPTFHTQLAYGFDRNQLVVGVGERFVSMSVRGPRAARSAFQSSGMGIEVGAVWKPENKPIRLGFAYRTPIRTVARYSDDLLPNEQGDLVIESGDVTSYLPKTVAVPWDVNFGFAVQFGARPMNPPWITNTDMIKRKTLLHDVRKVDREEELARALATASTSEERRRIEQEFEREQAADDDELERELLDAKWRIERDLLKMNRFYVQVAASLLITGPVEDAVGIESMVEQVVNRSGEKVVISPRLGIESGVIPDYLKLRAGTYLEPTRFAGGSARGHVTAGLDVKLAVWNVFGLWPNDYMWRLGLGADVAHRYSTWGVTIAGWYPRHQDTSDMPPPSVDPNSRRLDHLDIGH